MGLQQVPTNSKETRTVTLRLAAGEVKAVEHQRERERSMQIMQYTSPLGSVIRNLQLIALWTPVSLTCSFMTKEVPPVTYEMSCQGRYALFWGRSNDP